MRALIAGAVILIVAGTVALGYEGSIVFQGGHGAKALGMGGAFTALADDAMTALWNPAGLSFVESEVWLGGATSKLFGMVPFQYLAGGYSFGEFAVGFAWSNAVAGSQYTASLYAGSISLKLGDLGAIGASVKFYSETIAGSTETGVGFDLGILVPVTPEIAVGVVAKDVGGTAIGNGTVSSVYGAGFGLRLLDGTLVVAADVSLDGDLKPLNLGAGVELVVIDNLSLRAGITAPEIAFSDLSWRVGAGFAISGLHLDAAYVLGNGLGSSVVISATFMFQQLFAPRTPEIEPTR